MRINNNIMALNAHRQLTINQGAAAKAMEKLSSGLRINRAGDDAAGLAISEKMRGQIRGLKQAIRNAQDGISLIQTAEGALTETHAILQRMRELAVQAANDTNTSVDRAELQKEINELLDEIDRIADTTQFNTKNLLDGTFSGTFHIGANQGQNIVLSIDSMRTDNLGEAPGTVYEASDPVTYGTTDFSGSPASFVVRVGSTDTTVTLDSDYTDQAGVVAAINTQLAGTGVTAYDTSGAIVLRSTRQFQSGPDTSNLVDATATTGTTGALISTLRVDPETSTSGGVLTQADADAAITAINNAIEQVSAERSKLGAYQNRLEHTIANLGVSAENLQAAESRIRDVDMAQEMMTFTRYQILQQASIAMLAQANVAPQSVLQLLA